MLMPYRALSQGVPTVVGLQVNATGTAQSTGFSVISSPFNPGTVTCQAVGGTFTALSGNIEASTDGGNSWSINSAFNFITTPILTFNAAGGVVYRFNFGTVTQTVPPNVQAVLGTTTTRVVPGGGPSIGSPVGGGVPKEVLFVDASGNLAQSPNFIFNNATGLEVNGNISIPSAVGGFYLYNLGDAAAANSESFRILAVGNLYFFQPTSTGTGILRDVTFTMGGVYSLYVKAANGHVAVNSNTATSGIFNVTGLSVFANNAAAIAGSLTAGAFYRTGADPDVVCVVH